tara:strand:+ start:2698 stop:3012 length:315 start_codon:yes stop_codon:yes gene_type:complete
MAIFNHENFTLDLTNSNKARLYKDGRLMFMGDGYRAITMLIRNSQDAGPVRERFRAQLNQREKPKFKANDLDSLKKEAFLEEEKRKAEQAKNQRKKVIRRPGIR